MTVLVLGLLGMSLYPPAYWRFIGWSKGEAFYKGRPTSYWSEQINKADHGYNSLTEILAIQLGFSLQNNRWEAYDAFRTNPENVQSGPPVEAISVLVELLAKGEDGGLFAVDNLCLAYSEENPYAVSEVRVAIRAAVPKIVEVLRSPQCQDRRWPACILGCIGQEAEIAVPALIEIIQQVDANQDKGAYEIYFMLVTLGQIGPGAREAIPTLVKLRDGDAGSQTIELKNGPVKLSTIATEVLRKVDANNEKKKQVSEID